MAITKKFHLIDPNITQNDRKPFSYTFSRRKIKIQRKSIKIWQQKSKAYNRTRNQVQEVLYKQINFMESNIMQINLGNTNFKKA